MASPARQLRVPDQRLHNILTAQRPADLSREDLHDMDFREFQLAGANLMKANLSGANLTDVNLSGAAVWGANFCDAVVTSEQAKSARGWFLANWSPGLTNTMGLPSDHSERFSRKDFHGYVMDGESLRGLDLSGVELAEASLRDADLTNTTGLTARQLRGADLRLAQLPPEIANSLNTLPGVDEATKTSRKVFLTMLAACVYCWLTILSTTDVGLLIGSLTLALPIVQTPIPVVAFFGAAPVLLLIIYLYFHFSLQNLWDALATLPAFFPDGRPLHERALPWILSPFVRVYFKLLVPSCTRMARFQVSAVSLLAWWSVPFTLIAFFLRFLVRHDPWITALQIVVTALSVWLAVRFFRITKDTLQGCTLTPLPWRRALFARKVWVGVLSGALAGSLLGLFSVGCFRGEVPRFSSRDEALEEERRSEPEHWVSPPSNPADDHIVEAPPLAWSWRTAAPKFLNLVGWDAFGNLVNVDLSRKPENWDGKDLDAVKGAHLQGRLLRRLDASGSFAVRADFFQADLSGASFESADLRAARFAYAKLQGAVLELADLRFANFDHARVANAQFHGANIEGAVFVYAHDLDLDELKTYSFNWILAHFDDAELRKLKVCSRAARCDYEDHLKRKDFSDYNLSNLPFKSPNLSGANFQHSRLRKVNFSKADLSKADLRHADLEDTDLTGANLAGADLRGTDLSKTHGLIRVQIESALVDQGTKLPPELEDQKPFTPEK